MVKRISEGSYRPGAVKLLQKFGYRFARFIHHLKKNDYTVPREDLGKSVVVCFKNTFLKFYYVIFLHNQIINSP